MQQCCMVLPIVMDTLPIEISTIIVSSLNLRDAENMYNVISKAQPRIKHIYMSPLKDRLDAQRYLRKLTSHPEQLMQIMKRNCCIITGGCVTPYFFPDIQATYSTWSLICYNGNASQFMMESENIGISWKNERIYSASEKRDVHVGSSCNYTGNYERIELLDIHSDTPINALTRIPITITQCAIEPSVAYHMYYSDTESRRVKVWMKNMHDTVNSYTLNILHGYTFGYDTILSNVLYYKDSGFDVSSYDKHEINKRHINDKDSYIYKFTDKSDVFSITEDTWEERRYDSNEIDYTDNL